MFRQKEAYKLSQEDLVNILKEGTSIEDVERALASKKALDEVMTVTEAAAIWGKSLVTVKQACQTGYLHPGSQGIFRGLCGYTGRDAEVVWGAGKK